MRSNGQLLSSPCDEWLVIRRDPYEVAALELVLVAVLIADLG
jgi:hypothetical protein